jgi:hypothetical protein
MTLCRAPQNHTMRVAAVAALHLLHLLAAAPALHAASSVTSPGCLSECGEVSIPYPFGVGAGCYAEGFQLTCDETHDAPKLLLGNTSVVVLNISLHDGSLHIDNGVVSLTGRSLYSMDWGIPLGGNGIFTLSSFWNSFFVMGCGFRFQVRQPGADNMIVVCRSRCLSGRPAVATDGTCSGAGCCEASLPGSSSMYSIKLESLDGTATEEEQPFNATFVIADKEWWITGNHGMLLQEAVSDGQLGVSSGSALPLQIKAGGKWNFGNLSCADAPRSSGYGCLSSNSYCHDHWNGESSGYICRCSDGYEGNPYIRNGCKGMQLVITEI